MRIRLTSILICIVAMGAKAQQRNDTVYVFAHDNEWAVQQVLLPFHDLSHSRASFGELQVQQKMEKGGLRRAQQAYDKRTLGFTAQGFNQLGRFKVGAVFTFNNQVEDSLANSLRNDLDPLTTYYPYAAKSGHYRRQNYIINTLISYRLTDHVTPYVNVDYHKHWTAGTVDPRVKSDRFILKVKPGVAFRYKEQELAGYVSRGKADETSSVEFVNSQFGSGDLHPYRMYHMNYGYGYSSTKDSARNTKYDTYKGYGMHYQGRLRNVDIRAGYDYQDFHNTNQVYGKSSVSYTGPRAIFNLYTTTAYMNLRVYQNAAVQHRLSVRYKNSNGYDGSLPSTGSLSIVNYKVDESELALGYSMQLDKHKPWAKEFGAGYGRYALHQRDLSQSVDLQVGEQRMHAFTNMVFEPASGDTYKLGLTAYLSTPTTNTFSYGSLAINDFVRNVANVDYYYYQLQKIGFAANVEYITGVFGKNRIGLFAGVDYHSARKDNAQLPMVSDFVPTGKRMNVNLGVRMYILSH